ncbi:hypothetical protein K525DRAFT_288935 [Schizophyllum commune Loenen D]|nr:hypothetical protein K525DRAFT_288935 [Schizophyllum commune Loenen D]
MLILPSFFPFSVFSRACSLLVFSHNTPRKCDHGLVRTKRDPLPSCHPPVATVPWCSVPLPNKTRGRATEPDPMRSVRPCSGGTACHLNSRSSTPQYQKTEILACAVASPLFHVEAAREMLSTLYLSPTAYPSCCIKMCIANINGLTLARYPLFLVPASLVSLSCFRRGIPNCWSSTQRVAATDVQAHLLIMSSQTLLPSSNCRPELRVRTGPTSSIWAADIGSLFSAFAPRKGQPQTFPWIFLPVATTYRFTRGGS